MSPALQAHLRLLHAIPRERVRTHHQQTAEERRRKYWRVTPLSTQEINTRVKALKERGLKQCEIAAQLRLSLVTVSRHVNNKIKGVR